MLTRRATTTANIGVLANSTIDDVKGWVGVSVQCECVCVRALKAFNQYEYKCHGLDT